MKIDKIVFSSSEEYSGFWNIQSFVWNKFLGIEPVCLLWGKIKNTDMSDKYGQIIEKEYDENLVKSLQLTWSKFHHTATEPNTTWIIGDMDLVPLQKAWFTDKIEKVHEDSYTHLASTEHERRGDVLDARLNYPGWPYRTGRGLIFNPDIYLKRFNNGITGLPVWGGFVSGPHADCGADLPAYYHAAKGSTFTKALNLNDGSFKEQVSYIIDKNKFGYGPQRNITVEQAAIELSHVPVPKEELYYWLADENYTSYKIYHAIKDRKIRYEIAAVPWGNPVDRLDRATWDGSKYEWGLVPVLHGERGPAASFCTLKYNMPKELRGQDASLHAALQRSFIIDIHCHRPYEEQESALREMVMTAWSNQ